MTHTTADKTGPSSERAVECCVWLQMLLSAIKPGEHGKVSRAISILGYQTKRRDECHNELLPCDDSKADAGWLAGRYKDKLDRSVRRNQSQAQDWKGLHVCKDNLAKSDCGVRNLRARVSGLEAGASVS